jgi:hypothetical protein
MRLDTKICTCAVAAFLVASGQVVGDESTFHFSGTLGSNARCPHLDSDFCGPYTGLLTIDDNQDAMEWIPGHSYYYRYAEAKIVFADGQTVTAHSPNSLPPKQSAIMGVTPKLRVETSGEYLRVTIDILDPEANFGVIAPQYFYGLGTFDPANLRDTLRALCGNPSMAKFFIVGGGCSPGPCVDSSLTPLRPTATMENEK